MREPWSDYLARFHGDRAGITEQILTRCRAGDLDPYDWCVAPIERDDRVVLDVACGSGPTADRLGRWVGTDPSMAELAAAQANRRGPVLRASAHHLPVRGAATATVVCSMGLQVIEPLDAALHEIARVLQPGGQVVALLPATRPMPWRDALTYGRLQIALRARIRYPNDRVLGHRRFERLANAAGLSLVLDERLAFTLPLEDEGRVDELLRSLYLPDVSAPRLAAGRRVLRHRVGGALTVPLRRLVLTRAGSDA